VAYDDITEDLALTWCFDNGVDKDAIEASTGRLTLTTEEPNASIRSTVVMDLMGIVSVVTTIVTVASLIAASTPTPKDDEWLAKLYKFVDLLALNIGKAKQ
jgi:hypothetical protein